MCLSTVIDSTANPPETRGQLRCQVESDRYARVVGEKGPHDALLDLVVQDTLKAEHLDEPVAGRDYVFHRKTDVVIRPRNRSAVSFLRRRLPGTAISSCALAIERLWIIAGNEAEEYRRGGQVDPGVEPWAELEPTRARPARRPLHRLDLDSRPRTHSRRVIPASLSARRLPSSMSPTAGSERPYRGLFGSISAFGTTISKMPSL